MFNFIEKLTRNKIYLVAFVIIILIGAFLRSYHFSDWLHFEMDQSRDAKIISFVVENGIDNLPLLGPRAGGTFLRLGPIFYYMEYASALVFGNTPSGMAVFNLILGIAAIPIFYFFCLRYFRKKIALSLTLLFSVSLFMVLHSRFAWNPNPLMFFSILTFYALLRTVDREEKRKGLWLALSVLALTVSTQLHFLAFVSYPIIFLIFLLIKRPKITWKFWIISTIIVLFLYTPFIINEIKTKGANYEEFIEAVSWKSSKSKRTFPEKILRAYEEISVGNFLILSGSENNNFYQIKKVNLPEIKAGCPSNCRKAILWGIFPLFLFFASLILFFKSLISEKDHKRKDFLILGLFWFGLVYLVLLSLAFDISPRFFLLAVPAPFIFLGIVLDFLDKKIKYGKWVWILLILFLTISNLKYTKERFWQLENTPRESFKPTSDRILKEKNRVTLEQQLMIIDYVKEIYQKNKYPVYINSDAYYRRSFLYHLEQIKIPRDDFRDVKIYEKGNYFLIYPTLSNFDKDIEKYNVDYNLIEKKQFGTLLVLRLIPKPESIQAIIQEFNEEKNISTGINVPKRYTWEELFSEETAGDNVNEEDL